MEKDIQYTSLLKQQLQQFSDENRFLEFKSNYQDVDRIGKYISALSNGACLDNEQKGYLYFGVDDTTHAVKGTKFDYAHEKAIGNQDLELYLRRLISPKINFTIEEFLYENTTRVVVFIIPASEGEPTTYQGKPYIRVNSQTTELTLVAKEIAQVTNQKAQYTKNRGLEDAYYKELILTALEQHKQLSRPEINTLLLNKLPDALNDQQKLNKINTLLTALRRTEKIKVGKSKLWELY